MFASVLLFVKADVLNEESILKWYKEAHLSKGKSIFLEQMKTFVEWLKNAEEGKHCNTYCVRVCVCERAKNIASFLSRVLSISFMCCLVPESESEEAD